MKRKMGDHHVSSSVNLPPGFRFCPTDEELVLHFLSRKATLLPCNPDIIPDLHLYPSLDPWELDGKALSSGKHWYFFCRETMEEQVTENGFWKKVGVEEPIFSCASTSKQVGMKKYLVYFMGEPPNSFETNWMMQEYHLCCSHKLSAASYKRNIQTSDWRKWVLCRVYQREGSNSCLSNFEDEGDDSGTELSCLDEIFFSLADDDLDDVISFPN